MVITLVSDVFGENNGTTVTIARLMEGLKQRGHTVRLLSPYKTDEPGFYTVPTLNLLFLNNYVAKNGVQLSRPSKKIIDEAFEGTDLVHIILPFFLGRAAAKEAHRLGLPITAAFHCQPENFSTHLKLRWCAPFNNFLYGKYRRKIYKYAEYIHCPTDFIERELKKHNYTNPMEVISNGVSPVYKKTDSQKPAEYKDKYCILFTGRFSSEKRHDILIDAIKCSKHSDKIQLIFAGRGPTLDKMKKRAEKLKNPPLFGFYTSEELNEVINWCDLYVHPSDIEIEAIACLEAITCGVVPVISDSKASATGAFALCPENLFKAGEPKSLAARIDYWIENPKIKEKYSEQYLEYAKRFEMNGCMDKMEAMFKKVLNEHKSLSETK